jgi:crotonobetainyl-CoA:carnitine CoA-transferase CaiB-like acyl-CoA transferase
MAVFSSLLLGLAHQRRTGEGQFIATSMITGNAYAYSDDFNSYAGKHPFPIADPEQLGFHGLYRLYETADGWIFLAAPTQREWESLAVLVDRPDLLAEGAYATPASRIEHAEALGKTLTELFAGKSAADWEAQLAPKGVGCVEVYEGGQSSFTCTDPWLRESGLVVEVDHPTFGPILRHGPLVQLSRTPARIAPSGLRGDHNDVILAGIGYSPDDIAGLVRDKVIFPPD